MTFDELLAALFETLTEHVRLPEGYGWTPWAAVGIVTGFGILLLLRGAKWAPAMTALALLAIGGGAGTLLGDAIGLNQWLTGGIVGILAFVIGLTLFRFWQAILLAACFVLAGLSVYYVKGLHREIAQWNSASTETGFVTLPAAGTVVGEQRPGAIAELSSLWTHLNQHNPDFATTFWTLVSSTGLAGLIFGLLLPRAARALWAASVGTVLAGIGTTALLKQFAPGVLDWLMADNLRGWAIVGTVWLVSLILNLLACGRRKSPGKTEEEKPSAKNKPALA